jgi:uncharacterized protein (DUF58 family)
MLQPKIRISRGGVYLLLFSLTLLQSSFYTGTNILFLLDFFLFALLLFNYLYLRRLRKLNLILFWPESCEEDSPLKVSVQIGGNLPFLGKCELDWARFNESYKLGASVMSWDSENCLGLDPFPIRGKYQLKQMRIFIDYPLKLFVLTAQIEQDVTLLVHPKSASNTGSVPHWSEGMGGGNSDFAGLRPWRQGDGVRNIAWKHYARTGQMQVKTWETGEEIAPSIWLKWEKTEEKEYFQQMTGLMLYWLQQQIPFRIQGKNGGYDSLQGQRELLNYLAAYEMGGDR